MSRVITPNELSGFSESQLRALYWQTQARLAQSAADSPEEACHRASLEVIARAIAARPKPGPKPPGF